VSKQNFDNIKMHGTNVQNVNTTFRTRQKLELKISPNGVFLTIWRRTTTIWGVPHS